ncbi:MAG: DNA-binding protein WhiA, partial [Bacilli bacterium]|nr:DNA-binding protein WhiA [Bacilli bacterium]
MSFTVQIKEEISHAERTKSERLAGLSGYIRNNANITKNKVTMTTENKFIVERVTDGIKDFYNTKSQIDVIENLNFSKKELYQITIKDNLDEILKDLCILDDKGEFIKTVPNYLVGGNEEIRGYLRGVFSATCSINDPKTSRYHMELLVKEAEEAVFVQKLLNIFGLNAKILNRDKGYMIYIKEAEKISDFLKIIGANKAVMYYEDVRVYRDKKNKT